MPYLYINPAGMPPLSNKDACREYIAYGPVTVLFRNWVGSGNINPVRFLAAPGKSLLKVKAHHPRLYWGSWLVPIEFTLIDAEYQKWEQHYSEFPIESALAVIDY